MTEVPIPNEGNPLCAPRYSIYTLGVVVHVFVKMVYVYMECSFNTIFKMFREITYSESLLIMQISESPLVIAIVTNTKKLVDALKGWKDYDAEYFDFLDCRSTAQEPLLAAVFTSTAVLLPILNYVTRIAYTCLSESLVSHKDPRENTYSHEIRELKGKAGCWLFYPILL